MELYINTLNLNTGTHSSNKAKSIEKTDYLVNLQDLLAQKDEKTFFTDEITNFCIGNMCVKLISIKIASSGSNHSDEESLDFSQLTKPTKMTITQKIHDFLRSEGFTDITFDEESLILKLQHTMLHVTIGSLIEKPKKIPQWKKNFNHSLMGRMAQWCNNK